MPRGLPFRCRKPCGLARRRLPDARRTPRQRRPRSLNFWKPDVTGSGSHSRPILPPVPRKSEPRRERLEALARDAQLTRELTETDEHTGAGPLAREAAADGMERADE